MNDLIQSHWLNNELPGINCITHADGAIVITNCYRNEEGIPYVFPLCETTIESLIKFNEDIWTKVQIFTRVIDSTSGYVYVGGEGGMGNEGFLAATDMQNNFEWAIFFEQSNPFEKLYIENNKLYGISTYNEKYSIDLPSPLKIDIQILS